MEKKEFLSLVNSASPIQLEEWGDIHVGIFASNGYRVLFDVTRRIKAKIRPDGRIGLDGAATVVHIGTVYDSYSNIVTGLFDEEQKEFLCGVIKNKLNE